MNVNLNLKDKKDCKFQGTDIWLVKEYKGNRYF